MTREEEIRRVLGNYKFASVEDAFILGANWADTHPDNTAWLDKACAWWDKRLLGMIPKMKEDMIEQFKKAIEQ